MAKNRMVIPLENFSEHELDCKCGCGKKTHPKMALALQAFIYILESHFGLGVRCIVHSGARCLRDHIRVTGDPDDTSYHMGLTRRDEGDGAAVDCHFESLVNFSTGKSEWVVLDKKVVANLARESNLFGGIGYKTYPALWKMIHLDIGPERNW